MKKILYIILGILFASVTTVYGATVFNSSQVGNSPVNGYILQTNGTVSTWVPNSGGGGSGGGTFSTTTSTVSGQLINYPNNITDIVAIGSNATTSAEWWYDPNVFVGYLKGKFGIGTTSPYAALSVVGEVVVSNFTGTTTATSTLAGPLKITNNHTDQYMLGVIAGGNLGSASAPVQNGAFVVDNTLNTLTPGLYVSSGQAGVPSNPLAIFRSENSAYNQGLLWLLGNSANTGGAAYNLKVQDGNPDIEFVESDQTAPAGKYEIDVNNDNIRINGRNTAENSFDSIALFARNDKGGTGQGGRFCIGCGFSDSGLENSRVNIIRNPSNTSMSYLTLSTASTGPAMGDIFNVTNDGNVGINNATPLYRLHLVDTQTANSGTLNGQYIGQTFTPTSVDYSSGANGLYIQSSLGGGTAVDSTDINSYVRGAYLEGPNFSNENIHATYGVTGASGTGVGAAGNVGNAYGAHGYVYSNGSGAITNSFPVFSECRQTGTGSMGTCVGFYGDASYTAGNFPTYIGVKIPSYSSVASSSISALFGDAVGIGATTTPGSLLSIQGVANLHTATSTFYSTGGINLTNGCFAIGGVCVGGGSFSNTIANGGTGSTQFAPNSIVTSNFDGSALIATGTQLTVGNILATTTAQSNFGGAIGTPNTLILGNTPAVRSLNTSNGLSLQGTLSSVAGYETILTSNGNTQTFTSGTGGTTNVINTYAPTSGTGVYNALNVIPTLNQTGGANGITRGLYINPVLTAVADFRALEVAVGKSIFNDVIGVGTSTPISTYSMTLASSTAPQLSLSAGGGLPQWTMRNAGGNLYFATTTVAGTATTSSSALSIGNLGNVGIGGDATGGKLQIFQTVNTNVGGLAFTNIAQTGSARLWADASDNARFDAGGSAGGSILLNGAGTGKVGIGTTTPGSIFSIQGVANFVASAVSTIYNGLRILGTLTLPSLGTPAGAFLAVDASGNVIATSTPSSSGTATSTLSMSIFHSTNPDTTGNSWFEPYTITASTDNFGHLVGVASSTTAKTGFYGTVEIPGNYNGGCSVQVIWTAPITTGNAVFDFAYRSVGGNDTESLDDTIQETVTVTDAAPTAVNRRLTAILAPTCSNFSANETMEFYISRDGVDANDTLGSDVIIHDVVFKYSN